VESTQREVFLLTLLGRVTYYKTEKYEVGEEEFKNLKFHSETSSWGDIRKLPRAFTYQA
jgi:hypothetical protein